MSRNRVRECLHPALPPSTACLPSGSAAMTNDHAAVVRRWFEEVWNLRREQTIEELLTAESVCHSDDGPVRGPDGFKQRQYLPFLAAFPDLRVEVESVLDQGDQVVVRWSATGTHCGGGLGCPPTGRAVTLRGLTWVTVRD